MKILKIETDLFAGVLSFRILAAIWLKLLGQCATKWSAIVRIARSTCGRRYLELQQ